MPQHGVLSQTGMVSAQVHHVVGPVGDPDNGQPRGVRDHELDVVGVGSAASQVDDNRGLGSLLDTNLQVAVGGLADARSGDHDLYRRGCPRSAGNGDDGRPGEGGKCLCRNAVSGYAASSESFVATADGLDGDAGLLAYGDHRVGRSHSRAVVQTAQPFERGEPP